MIAKSGFEIARRADRIVYKPGDVIVRFQGEELQDPRDLTRRVAATPPGTSVKLDVVRPGGEHATLNTRIGELKESRTAEGG